MAFLHLFFFSLSLSLFFFFAIAARNVLLADGDLPPANSPPPYGGAENPFKPSVVVVVGVLTCVFSVTFLLLLYAKHCRRVNATLSDEFSYSNTYHMGGVRKNSGVDRAVIESLPVFRFRSLIGEKEGLECAVCLARFEPSELLRLLPKCRHAFHVECVDTWLDAHSTCPLCRYRVDPEDILLLDQPDPIAPTPQVKQDPVRLKRVLGRHSSAGPGSGEAGPTDPASFRRSLDSLGQKKRSEPSVTVGCFERGRKDGLLLSDNYEMDRSRFEHRIVVSRRNSASGAQEQRWSGVQPLDLLCLRSEGINGSGRSVINERSVSEITGVSRFRQGKRAGVMWRWLESQSRPHDDQDVRPGRASGPAAL